MKPRRVRYRKRPPIANSPGGVAVARSGIANLVAWLGVTSLLVGFYCPGTGGWLPISVLMPLARRGS